MGFLARERFCDMDAQPNSNSGAFDQDVLASPVWALARIGTFMGRLSTQSNSLPIGRQYNKRESLRMGPLSDAEPMREGESIWEKGGLRAFKNQWKGKTCSLHSFLSKETEGKKGGDREEEIQNSHSTPWIVHTDSSFICNSFRVGNVGCWWGCAPSPSSSALQPE
ncbi:hypothetical protein CTI12_AA053050 [Artemisia annua]|uniref:Uncharacterized protein n=1 Tax=Artemisia annua TaxID=35608 RepID=A0A2U1QAU0_ARTAN|nr:hypothetical protein CTI12_AA053050 [Artemisia annua]